MVLAVDRNAVSTLVNLGWCKFLTGGSGDEAIQLIEQAIRLSPRDPSIAGRYYRSGLCIYYFRALIRQSPGAQRRSQVCSRTPLSGRRLWPQRRVGPRRRRARRGAKPDWFRSLFDHRPLQGQRRLEYAGPPRSLRRHLSCRAAQGRDAGGMTATRRLAAILAARLPPLSSGGALVGRP